MMPATISIGTVATIICAAKITDSQGASVASSVNVTVSQALTSIAVSPASASVATGATKQFAATANDQFGIALGTQPTFTWSVSGGGTISGSGLFTAGTTAGGPFTVKAASGSVSGTASVTVTSSTATLVSVSVDTSPIAARTTGTGTVTFSSAPSADAVVSLTSSDPAVAVPDTMTVAAGQSSATFTYLAQAVTAQTSVTLTATYASVNKTASVVVTPPIDLTAAATGSSKITLYWTGIPTATGYNIYRGTVSGGPYPTKVTATPVAALDPGPGLTNMFMYSDTGLTSGTEYFYIVRGVAAGVENTQSNEDSALPDASAVPWDAANPAAIVALFTTAIQADAYPNIDEDTGDQYPTQAGLTTVVGPDGVMYQGNFADGSPAVAFPPSAHVDEYSGNAIYADGTSSCLPSVTSDESDSTTPGPSQSSALSFPISDLYPFTPDYTGIWREVISEGGAWGFTGVCGLPDTTDSASFLMDVHTYPPGATDSKTKMSLAGKSYSDAGDIYTGGEIVISGGKPTQGLDAGLVAQANTGGLYTPGWVPFYTIAPYSGMAGNLTKLTAIKFGLGLTVPLDSMSVSGHKVTAVHETRMQFITPASPHIPPCSAVLNIAEPIGGSGLGKIFVYDINKNQNKMAVLGRVVEYNYTSLAAFIPGWSSTANYDVKRVNSIAQKTDHYELRKTKAGPTVEVEVNKGYPKPNGPTEVSGADQYFLIDSSAVRGAYWGNNGDPLGVLINFGGTWQTWTSDNSLSFHSGAYPNSMLSGYGYVTWVDQNGFFFETGINLKANHTLP